MKRFKSYITEVAWRESLSSMLFNLPRAGIHDVKIPISPSIFKRIFPKSVRSTVFHVTDYDGIEKLEEEELNLPVSLNHKEILLLSLQDLPKIDLIKCSFKKNFIYKIID